MKRKLAGLIFLVATWGGLSAAGLAQATIISSSAAPSTITFTANDPDSPIVPGNSSSTISFTTTGGANASTWRVRVRASTANFGTCPSTVPATQVLVTCTSATASGGGTGTCSGPFNLTNVLQTVASGNEGTGTASYTVTLTFTFADRWRYIATTSPCSVTMNNRIIAN